MITLTPRQLRVLSIIAPGRIDIIPAHDFSTDLREDAVVAFPMDDDTYRTGIVRMFVDGEGFSVIMTEAYMTERTYEEVIEEDRLAREEDAAHNGND